MLKNVLLITDNIIGKLWQHLDRLKCIVTLAKFYCCLQGQLCGLFSGFDWVGMKMIMIRRINAYQCESMRITINTLIFIYLCHLALDHQRGKTLFLCDSQWFSLILNDSHQFSMILTDSQWFLNKSGIDSRWFSSKSKDWFSIILANSRWFSVILDDSCQFSVILNDSQWFLLILTNSQWFLLILNDSWISLELILK